MAVTKDDIVKYDDWNFKISKIIFKIIRYFIRNINNCSNVIFL